MKFSDYFELDILTQKDLDFLDGLTEKDVPFYIDPLLIETNNGEWHVESSRVIRSFFDRVFSLYKEGNVSEANGLLAYAREPNETRLGVSQGTPQGRGTSQEGLIEIFDSIRREGLLEDVINNYKELNLYVEGFAEDGMSDLVTNILRGKLAEYTLIQSEIHGLQLTEDPIEIGMSWDINTLSWQQVKQRALMIEEKLLLLVPKSIIAKKYLYTTDNYFSKSIYEWRQNYHKDNRTGLSRRKYIKTRDEYVILPPSQKDIDEKEIKGGGYSSKKKFAIDAIRENKGLIDIFNRKISHATEGTLSNRLTDEEIIDIVEENRAVI